MYSAKTSQKTGILTACEMGSAYDVKRMLKLKCDKHEKNKCGEEAIIVAAKGNHTTCVEALLDAGVSVDTTSPTGKTIQYYAEFYHTDDMLEVIQLHKRDMHSRP